MRNTPGNIHPDFQPRADEKAVVRGPNCRFTILTPGLVRMEFDPGNNFEDRPSQVFWYRKLPVPEFNAYTEEDKIKIETKKFFLTYKINEDGFTEDSLKIKVKDENKTWVYGQEDKENLRGTGRTLDGINGNMELEKGLVSPAGWTLVDDSDTLVFGKDGWLEQRGAGKEKKDLYFFAYGKNYSQVITDFIKVTGKTPLLPKWALGNWWSRYWEYKADDLKDLMLEFEQRGIPLTVCIVDMDWHIVENKYHHGWTGYTWNKDLFPDPEEFIDWLHQHGLRTALNLHPAEGVHPHEEQYKDMAEVMGIDPESKKEVEFDVTDRDFIDAYFKILHHPQEEKGIDFWWIDWQQGTETRLEGLDPLWALNYLHFYDLGRNKEKRPFIFSRWAGLGNHRHPIGFSGDTIVSWESLRFQPYFTANAANVAYGWWSHDIGGHCMGQEDPELYTRWVEFGVFSPIMRLHSTKNPFLDRRPWGHGREVYEITKEFMRLRHALIPYLYTMSWRNYQDDIPLITPMYHHYPEKEEAYACPDQYFFGSELLVAPYLYPRDEDTNLSRQVIWLPEGDWFNFFTGEHYRGDGWYALYGKLDEIPVFARAGAIIPLDGRKKGNDIGNPEELELHIFPGADNSFKLYEDDGLSQNYLEGEYALTRFEQYTGKGELEFVINPAEGNKELLPAERKYTLYFKGIGQPAEIMVQVNNQRVAVEKNYFPAERMLELTLPSVAIDSSISAKVMATTTSLIAKGRDKIAKTNEILRYFKMPSVVKRQLAEKITKYGLDNLEFLDYHLAVITDTQLRAILEIVMETGIHLTENRGRDKVVMWNNNGKRNISYRASGWHYGDNKSDKGEVTGFKSINLEDWKDLEWKVRFNFSDLLTVEYNSSKRE